MSAPAISVILTSYNHEKYIRGAIESVLGQTFGDIELIIWDDASTDGSWAIIRSYADPRIRTCRSETNSASFGMNQPIIEMARGKYVAIHHSDDVWEPTKLERQIACLESRPEIGAVFTNATAIAEDGQPFQDTSHFYYGVFDQPNRSRQEWLRYFFYNGNALCHPSILIRRNCHEDCGYYRYGLYQLADLDMWVRLCLKYPIHVLPEKLTRFRVRDDDLNMSAYTRDTRVRLNFEHGEIFQNYLRLRDVDDLVAVFPEAAPLRREGANGGLDVAYLLAMTTLQGPAPANYKLCALRVLFSLLNGGAQSEILRRRYGFDARSFVALTAEHDVFSSELVRDQNAAFQDRDARLRAAQAEIEALNAAPDEADALRAALAAAEELAEERLRLLQEEAEHLRAKKAEAARATVRAADLDRTLRFANEQLARSAAAAPSGREPPCDGPPAASGIDATASTRRVAPAEPDGTLRRAAARISRALLSGGRSE